MRKKYKTILAILTMENDGSFCYTLKVRKDDNLKNKTKFILSKRTKKGRLPLTPRTVEI